MRRPRFPNASVLLFLAIGTFALGISLPRLSTGQQPPGTPGATNASNASEPESASPPLEKATFGSGCFWCTEAVFLQLKGVHSVVSGYSGGALKNPTYKQVSTGLTGHAEVVQITYDPQVISYEKLLEVFWMTHDPTTLNRQGPDIGPQYRSVILYHNETQQQLASTIKAKLNAERAFGRPVVTEISPFTEFYPAEQYHQNFYELNRRNPYCRQYVTPKVDKVKKVFKEFLKTSPAKKT